MILERLQNWRDQVWSGLKHPVSVAIAVATVAHGLVLAIPVPDREKSEAEPEPTPTETVKISSLVGAAPPSQPKPKATPAQPKSEAAQPQPKAKPKAKPRARPAAAPAPAPAPAPASSSASNPAPSPSGNSGSDNGDGGNNAGGDGDEPIGNVQDTDPTSTGNNLIGELSKQVLAKLLQSSNDEQEMKDYMASVPTELMPEDQVTSFVNPADNSLLEGAFASLAIPQTTVSDAYFDFIEPSLVNSFGFSLEPQNPEYGGADLYFAQNTQDESLTFYFSMVKLKSGSGAFLVLWKEDPRT